jgi:hypothetical protein
MLNREQEKVTSLNTRLEEKVIRRTEALSIANAALQRESGSGKKSKPRCGKAANA